MNKARPYQTQLVQQIVGAFRAGRKEILLAACPNAGKTFMSLETAEVLHAAGDVQRVLVLAHGTKVLRKQYRDRLAAERPNLASVVDVRIPHELHRHEIGQYDLIIVDEAHQFYGEDCDMNTRILEKAKPKYVLLLTGSPAKFIADGFTAGDNMFCYSLQQLHNDVPEAVADVMIECAVSNYQWSEEDLGTQWGDMRDDVVATQEQTDKTLEDVLSTLKARLEISGDRLDGHVFGLSRARLWSLKKGWNMVLARLKKTIVATPSIEVAEQVGTYFAKLGVTCLVSHSKSDVESENIETFKSDDDVRLLVVVDRAQLGFDFAELFHFVDMTGSRNPDRIFQMLCRVVRASKDDPKRNKLFVKVMPPAFPQNHVRAFMSGVLSLAQQDFFEKWNGKGFGLRPIPVERRPSEPGGPGVEREPQVPFLKPGMMMFGDYFKALEHNPDDPLAVYAMARLGDVMGIRGMRDSAGSKAKVVEFYRANKRKPSKYCKDPEEVRIAFLLDSYTCKASGSYDAEVEAAVRALGWTTGSEKVERNKLAILDFIRTFGRRPRWGSSDPTERKLAQTLSSYIGPRYGMFDPDFKAQINALGHTFGLSPRGKSGKIKVEPVVDDRGVVYRSPADAAITLGLYRSNIKAVLSGKYRHTGGRTFRYATPEEAAQFGQQSYVDAQENHQEEGPQARP